MATAELSPTRRRPCLDCGKPPDAGNNNKRLRCASCAQRARWRNKNDPRRAKLTARNKQQHKGAALYERYFWMYEQYYERRLSIKQIGKKYNIPIRTIARWLKIHDIPVRDSGAALKMRNLRGPASHHWKGGPKPCPKCGGKKAEGANLCAKCWPRPRGDKHPGWKGLAPVSLRVRGWAAANWRPKIYERDDYTCRDCGDARGGNLHAHHIEPFSVCVREEYERLQPNLQDAEAFEAFVTHLITHPRITSLENGVTLCEDCHRNRHASEVNPHPGRVPQSPYAADPNLQLLF